MANWEKLNKEFDDALNSMTKEDWKSWYERFKQKQINQNKMTAVEKLIAKYEKQWNKYGMGSVISYSQVIADLEKLKKVEKSQYQETWETAHQAGRFEGKGIAEENWQTFETYWLETFKSE